MAKISLAIRTSDIAFPKRRGFARLKPAKHLQISRHASKLGASKGGKSIQTRTTNLKKSKFFRKLDHPFPKFKTKVLSLADSAKVFGVSRQAFRFWTSRYYLVATQNGTALMYRVSDLRRLYFQFRREFKAVL